MFCVQVASLQDAMDTGTERNRNRCGNVPAVAGLRGILPYAQSAVALRQSVAGSRYGPRGRARLEHHESYGIAQIVAYGDRPAERSMHLL